MRGKMVTFLLGLVVGIALALLAPRWLGPYFPEVLRSKAATEGSVVSKGWDNDALLLTISTSEGATLATFKERVAEIDLLVEEGDEITLALPYYQPFVEDPSIRRVRKKEELASPSALENQPETTAAEELAGDEETPSEQPEVESEPEAEDDTEI